MKYLLDKNILSNDLINNSQKRDDLCVTEEVLYEAGYTGKDYSKIRSARIQIVKLSKKHLDKLSLFMADHGANLKLINLFTGKGTADVVMISYILSERDNPESLFPEEYTIVTKDKELMSVADIYGIKCISKI